MIILLVVVALSLPTASLAVNLPRDSEVAATRTSDTPAPTPTPRPRKTPKPNKKPNTKPNNKPARTAKPTATPGPIAGPALQLGATPPVLPPSRDTLTVGYYEPGLAGQLPLVVAELSGYFSDAGFDSVTLVEADSTLQDVANGDIEFAVAPAIDAFSAYLDDPVTPAVAGYRNYSGKRGSFGGDVLIATPGLVEHEPATVTAFLSAYIRALQDLSDPRTSAAALALIEQSELAVPGRLARRWDKELAAFAPFDGGFGSYADASGYGELLDLLVEEPRDEGGFEDFLADHTLNIAQAQVGLHANPDAGLVGPPSITDIRVAVPGDPGGATSPIGVAEAEGYFTDAGFESVEIMDIEQPLLGLLNGELDFGVVDSVDAADGASQGLPAVAAAGHRNYAADGTYGGDVLLATEDLISDERTTASAFLIAYLQALGDMAPDATEFSAFDGGFGAAEQDGGVGELQAYLASSLGESPDLDVLIEPRVLEFAQAWWGLPSDPTTAAQPIASSTSVLDEEAA